MGTFITDIGLDNVDPKMGFSRENIVGFKVIEQPAEEPVTLSEARLYAKVDDDMLDDDDLINEMIIAARIQCEAYTESAYISRKIRAIWDYNPKYRVIEVPFPPLISIEKVFFIDSGNNEVIFDSSNYTVLITSDKMEGRVMLNSGETWPTDQRIYSSIGIEFTAGFGAANAVPADIKISIKKMINAMYENREPFAEDLPETAKKILSKYVRFIL